MAEATVFPRGVKGGQQAVQMFEVMDSSPQCLKKWSQVHRCSLL